MNKTILFVVLGLLMITSAFAVAPFDDNTWYFSFDDSTKAGTTYRNLINSSNNATIYNSPTNVTGKIQQAIMTDPTGTKSVTIPSSLITNNSEYVSYGGWIKPNSLATRGFILGQEVSGQLAGHGATIETTGYLTCYFSGGPGVGTDAAQTSAGTIGVGVYSHVMCTYNKTEGIIRAYINGTLRANASSTRYATKSANSLYGLGGEILDGSSTVTNVFNGSIDEFGYWNEQLSGIDIQKLYNSGAGIAFNYSAGYVFQSSINTFNVTITNGTNIAIYNSTTGYIYISNLTGDYNYTARSLNYNDMNGTINTSISNLTTLSFTRYNGFDLYIYDEQTGNIITQNLTINLYGQNTLYSNTFTTTSGYYPFSLLSADTYVVRVSNSNYTSRSYIVTITNNSFSTLNAYLINGSVSSVTFTVTDFNTQSVIANVIVSQQKVINSSTRIVSSCLSDVAGQCLFYYATNDPYSFSFTKSNYTTRLISFNPILSPTYSIIMSLNSSQTDYTGSMAGVDIQVGPNFIESNSTENISFEISVPQANIVNYSMTAYVPGVGTYTKTGTNAYGEILLQEVNITNINDSVIYVGYNYYLADGQNHNFSVIIPVRTYGDGTFARAGASIYGLSYFERIIISTIITIIMAAVAYWFGGTQAAGVIAIFVLGYMVAISMISVWIAAPSMLFLFFVIVRYS